MSKFIELPNGDSIHAEAIKAIRLVAPQPKGEAPYESELKPRVIVDFTIGDHGNCIVLDCETVDERDALAKRIKNELKS